jgi:hypothetical protein
MSTRKKRFWLATTLSLVLSAVAVGGWIWWLVAHAPPPQIITLSNGDRYQFAGVTYGTNPMPPSLLVRLGNLLPARMAKLAKLPQYNYPIGLPYYFYVNSPPNQLALRVWFKRLDTNAPPRSFFTGRLADQNGLEAGVTGYQPFFRSTDWTSLDFTIVPRRSREIRCDLYPAPIGGPSGATPQRIGSIHFTNPLRGQYPQWQPEPAPAEKKAGDIDVRIDSLAVQNDEPANTKIDVSLNYPEAMMDEWVVHDMVLSDATGNSLRTGPMGFNNIPRGSWQSSSPNSFNGVTQGTLWPGEAAWRVRVELKHTTGYTPTELVVFTNVTVPPSGPTNMCRLTNTTGGIQFVLTVTTVAVTYSGLVGSGSSGTTSGFEYELHLEMPGKPADMAMDLITAEPDQGIIRSMGFFGNDAYSFDVMLQDQPSTRATNLNLTFAVQKTRSVEFLVKPPKE